MRESWESDYINRSPHLTADARRCRQCLLIPAVTSLECPHGQDRRERNFGRLLIPSARRGERLQAGFLDFEVNRLGGDAVFVMPVIVLDDNLKNVTTGCQLQ